jgi:TonB family protein
MTHIRNRFDIQNDIEEDTLVLNKKLPNCFLSDDEIPHWKSFLLSIATHLLLIILCISLQTFVFSKLPKPELPTRDIEFKLVQAEENTPINKKTKIRSDRNTRAGGKHDPKKPISEPGKTSTNKQQKPKPTPALPQKTVSKQIKNIMQPKVAQQPAKTVVKQQTAPVQQPVKKPTTVSAPSAAKPSLKPAVKAPSVSAPTAPKLAAAPKSPFAVPVAKSNAPVGSTYRPQGSSGTSSGSSKGGTSGGAPAPRFSSTSGGSGGGVGSKGLSSGGSSYGTRGSGGGAGSGSNPGPGNPNGKPGIDSIRQPNWGPYMRDLEQRIKRNWFPPKGDSSKRVVITFTIAKDGRLLSKRITKSSGVPLADQAAMKAIESTAPFRPLPPEFKGSSVPIEFTFDYNVLNSVLR